MEEEQKEEFFQTPPQVESNRPLHGDKNGSAKKYFTVIVVIVVLLLLIFGASKFIGGAKNSNISVGPSPTLEAFPSDTPAPTQPDQTPTPTQTNTPTPKPTVNPIDQASGLDRSKIAIHVLNGNGTAGASKKVADLLESLGYNVTETSNADNFNYDKTVIQVTSDKSDYLDLLNKDLSGSYSIGTTSADLTPGDNYQAVVIVGQQ